MIPQWMRSVKVAIRKDIQLSFSVGSTELSPIQLSQNLKAAFIGFVDLLPHGYESDDGNEIAEQMF